MSSKFNVLIFGGCGFIGRHIVAELIERNIATYIRVVDKVPPQMAWLNKNHENFFKDSRVTFKSANLINLVSCESCFGDIEYDLVINAAAETKTGQEEAVYKEGILKVSSNCAKVAASRHVKCYVEISSSFMASSDKTAFKEADSCIPWSTAATFKLEAEEVIKNINNFNWIIVRPAIVYGEADKLGLTPRMIIGGIFKHLGAPMKLLWDENLKMNTVHVKDLARAVIWLCQMEKYGEIYHVVDDGDSTQAMTESRSIVQLVNENHLEPWAKMCASKNLENTPLSPYIDVDALSNKHVFLDGSKLRKEGFKFTVPNPTKKHLLQVLDDFIGMNLLPRDIYSSNTKNII